MAKNQKKKRKKSRVQRLKRSFILLLLLIIAVSCVCLFAPVFNITEVMVEGNAQVTDEEILDRTSIVVGSNIFKMNKKSVKKGLKSLAYLDTIKISRRLPSKIKISVTESYAELIFPHATGYLVSDSEGKLLEVISDCEGWEVPHILGVEIDNFEISEKISVQDEVKFDIIFDCIRYLKEKGHLSQLKELDFTDISNIWVKYKEGHKVNFAKFEDMEYKMKMLEAIMPQVDRSEGTYIDLTTPSKVFTGKIEPTPEPTQEASEQPADGEEQTSVEEDTAEESTESDNKELSAA
ncbi:MAG: FtsQ-type POTRA domain-containing protein [Clostridia bacterium]|nr:FtsQ-type POTRA domain-containing protein [Clostridia bacterium]